MQRMCFIEITREEALGHITDSKQAYGLLQKRLDQKVKGAPDSPTLMKILSILFKPEDAELARHLPHNFTSLDTLSKRLKMPQDELNDKLTDMARRGLLFDMEHDGQRYFILLPVMIGLFEFVFMRCGRHAYEGTSPGFLKSISMKTTRVFHDPFSAGTPRYSAPW
jgi:hypothetical protein